MRYIELFAGIGGFRYGLEKASAKIEDTANCADNERQCPPSPRHLFRCVWANDNDRYASAIYRYHYGETCEADIRTVDVNAIPEHDLLCAGFPCQSFSIAGKRGGFEDTRGTLFFEICRVLRAKRTKYLFLENVKGLLSHDDGYTFQTIIGTLDELGYDCQWQVLNSKDYGVPQNRERVFIIGNFRGQPQPQVFPIGEDVGRIDEGECEATNVRTLQGGGHSGGHHSGMTVIQVGHRTKGKPRYYQDEIPAMTQDYGTGGGNVPMIVQKKGFCDDRICTDVSPALMSCANTGGKHQAGISHKNPLVIANALDADGYLRSGERPRDENGKPQLLPIGYRRIRRLTPIECERLQAFPDDWTKYGVDKDGKQITISDTQRYKCCGNAVTTSVIMEIGKQIIRGLL